MRAGGAELEEEEESQKQSNSGASRQAKSSKMVRSITMHQIERQDKASYGTFQERKMCIKLSCHRFRCLQQTCRKSASVKMCRIKSFEIKVSFSPTWRCSYLLYFSDFLAGISVSACREICGETKKDKIRSGSQTKRVFKKHKQGRGRVRNTRIHSADRRTECLQVSVRRVKYKEDRQTGRQVVAFHPENFVLLSKAPLVR